MEAKRSFDLVGKDFPRSDAVARVTGREVYTVDVSLPRMLHGRILSSPYAHANATRFSSMTGRNTSFVSSPTSNVTTNGKFALS